MNKIGLLPKDSRDLKHVLRRHITDSELAAPVYALAMRRSELFPFAGTDLLVEGYPRSANTFALCALKWSNPELRYASHLHACGSIKYATKKHIPTLLLIREPLGAVVSLAIRENLRLDYCLQWYLKYYRCVADNRESIVIADFSAVTTELETVYGNLRRAYGLSLRRPPTTLSEIAEVKSMVIHSENRFAGGIVSPLKVAIPTEEKRLAAPAVESAILSSRRLSKLLERCNLEYKQLVPGNRQLST